MPWTPIVGWAEQAKGRLHACSRPHPAVKAKEFDNLGLSWYIKVSSQGRATHLPAYARMGIPVPSPNQEVFMANESIPLTDKGHPLRRKDDLIYYGDMADSHIILLQIQETKPVGDLKVATKVNIQLQLTDPDLKSRDRVVKRSEKDSLYAAIDIASVWLERALAAR